MNRRFLALCALLVIVNPSALGQTFPTKPVRIIMNYTPGGPTDLIARTVGGKLQELTGQPFLIENMPSATGAVGTQAMARSAPDGYTMMYSTPGHTTMGLALYEEKLGFDPFRDITPVAMLVNSTQMIVAHPALGVKSIPELVALAKSKPGQLNYGSVGVGTSTQLGIELLKSMAGIDMVHVPYKGTAPVMQDLLAGRVHVVLNSLPTIIQYVRAGKLVALAVGSTTRSAAAPDIPTMEELGYKGFQVSTWGAFFVPAKTPAAIVARLNALTNQALVDPQVVKTLTAQGTELTPTTTEAFSRLMREEYERWKKVIIEAKIAPE